MPPKAESNKGKNDAAEPPAEERLKAEKAKLEAGISSLTVGLIFLQSKLHDNVTENSTLKEGLQRVSERLQTAGQDYVDILDHKELALHSSEARIQDQLQQVQTLQAALQRAKDEIIDLVVADEAKTQKLQSVQDVLQDRDQLKDALWRQDVVVAKQSEELSLMKAQMSSLQDDLSLAAKRVADLTLRASGTKQMKVLFDEPWLVGVSHYPLSGERPRLRDGASLACFAGKLLLLFGGEPEPLDANLMASSGRQVAGFLGSSREMNPLRLDTLTWQRPIPGKHPASPPLQGHTTATVGRTKMVVFGGQRGPSGLLLNDVSLLHTDTMKWMACAVRGTSQPLPRRSQSMAATRERVYIFGGERAEGLLNDLWEYNMDTTHWTQFTYFMPSAGAHAQPPAPRRGASLSASEDGRRLWLFGGNTGSQSTADLFYFDTQNMLWSQVAQTASWPAPREMHAATLVGQYLMVAGGLQHYAPGGGPPRLHGDAFALEATSLDWECLHQGTWAAAVIISRPCAHWSVFHGSKLITLKPGAQGMLDEMQVLEFSLPEDIECLRNERRAGAVTYDTLELLEEAPATATASSLEVAWRPPTKGAERIASYKVMMATAVGVVRDVYKGTSRQCRVAGLKPSLEHIFCVKAIYDDGSFMWSEPKAFQTRA